MPFAVALCVAVACSAGNQGSNGVNPRGGAGSSNGGGAGTFSLATGGSTGGSGLVLGGSGGGASNLPTPWQYFANDPEFGFKDASLGDDVKNQFAGTMSASGGPSLVYPLDGAMHPMNIGDITFQWQRGSAQNTVFRVDAKGGSQTFHFFLPCQPVGSAPDQCSYSMPASEWLDLGNRFKGGQVQLQVFGSDGHGGAVTASATRAAFFSPEPVLGGLYYWARSRSSIMRATFGAKIAVPYVTPDSASNAYHCAGCHSVSRNGKVVAFTVQQSRDFPDMGIQTAPTDNVDQPYVRPTMGVSTTTAYPRTAGQNEPQDQFGQNVALNPDGTIAAVNGARFDGVPPSEEWFELRDARTGLTLTGPDSKPSIWPISDPLFGPSRLPILPEWSPDGNTLAVTMMDRTTSCGWSFFSCQSGISLISVANHAISAPQTVVPFTPGDPMFHFYPSWSPDGKYLAFASAPDQSAKMVSSSDNHNAVLRLVPVDGAPHACPGPTCYELTNGTQYGVAAAMAQKGGGSTWPKFTPFDQAGGKIMFISFTSRIDYGFRSQARAQLWMFAIDTSKLGSGDPSFAPIWIPTQDITDENFTPYWTESLPCDLDSTGGCKGCLGSEECVLDSAQECHCEAVVK